MSQALLKRKAFASFKTDDVRDAATEIMKRIDACPQWRGSFAANKTLVDYQIYSRGDHKWWFSFAIKPDHLLFYFRGHATGSGKYRFDRLTPPFTEEGHKLRKSASREWIFRIYNLEEAAALAEILKLPTVA